jgi:hypothetical protein
MATPTVPAMRTCRSGPCESLARGLLYAWAMRALAVAALVLVASVAQAEVSESQAKEQIAQGLNKVYGQTAVGPYEWSVTWSPKQPGVKGLRSFTATAETMDGLAEFSGFFDFAHEQFQGAHPGHEVVGRAAYFTSAEPSELEKLAPPMPRRAASIQAVVEALPAGHGEWHIELLAGQHGDERNFVARLGKTAIKISGVISHDAAKGAHGKPAVQVTFKTRDPNRVHMYFGQPTRQPFKAPKTVAPRWPRK